jgi:hypothetical protein
VKKLISLITDHRPLTTVIYGLFNHSDSRGQ